MSKTEVTQTENELTFTRTFAAHQALVFDMFKNPEHVKKWWGPREWPVTESHLDFRPGGSWHYTMQGPEGKTVKVSLTYKEIDEPHKLVYVDGFTGQPQTTTTTVTFSEVDGHTTVTSHVVYQNPSMLQAAVARGMVGGFSETWDQLAELLER